MKYYTLKLISVKARSHQLKTVSLKSLRAVPDSGQLHSELSRTAARITQSCPGQRPVYSELSRTAASLLGAVRDSNE